MTSRYTAYLLPLLLVAAMGSLLLGLFTGLMRAGWAAPADLPVNGMLHGPLMINGFLATLISLERAAALQRSWSYIAPVCLALSTLLFLTGHPAAAGPFLLAGSLMLLVVLLYLVALQPAAHHVIMVLGGLSLLAGNALFLLGQPVHELVLWWAAFPMLTIFGERLELNRVMRPPPAAVRFFTVLVTCWLLTMVLMHLDRELFWYAGSLIWVLLGLWLMRYDVARRTIRSVEWSRYMAFCLLSGYGWLILAGLYGLAQSLPAAGPSYDVLLHMLFVGFVFSMIFAHAALILPLLTGLKVPYHSYFYLPLVVLHGALLVRFAGDALGMPVLLTVGSYGNVAAILLFFGGILGRALQAGYAARYG